MKKTPDLHTWNYRVVHDLADNLYKIAEVYYSEKGSPQGWCSADLVGMECVTDLYEDLSGLHEAFRGSVLVYDPKTKKLKEKI